MYLQLQITYRTLDGRYETARCNIDHRRVVFPNDFVQQWALENLPDGSCIVHLRSAWAAIPPDEAVLMRIDQAPRGNLSLGAE